MPRRSGALRLCVFLNSRHVGHLVQDTSGAVEFRYADHWLSWPEAFAISLSLPLREERYVGAAVLALFDNLLPDNPSIRRAVAERAGADGTDAMSLLAALGRDCVGALQFLPAGAVPGPAGVVGGTPLTEAEIADILRHLSVNPLGINADTEFRISLAGAQEKTALLRHGDAWLRPTGSTATTHILKPQIGQLANGLDLSASVENEYLCLKLTTALGLATATAEIAQFEDQRVLVVERFDRVWTPDGRLLRRPQEDMCQALGVPWTRKYESEGGPGIVPIADLLAASDEPTLDRRAFLKANLAFWLLGATDGHAKNFSVALGPRGGFAMTPLYDVISLQPSLDAGLIQHKHFRLAMAIGDRRHYRIPEIQRRHFVQTAKAAGIARSTVEGVIEELIETTPAAVDQVRSDLSADFPAALADSVFGGVERRVAQLTRQRDGPYSDL